MTAASRVGVSMWFRSKSMIGVFTAFAIATTAFTAPWLVAHWSLGRSMEVPEVEFAEMVQRRAVRIPPVTVPPPAPPAEALMEHPPATIAQLAVAHPSPVVVAAKPLAVASEPHTQVRKRRRRRRRGPTRCAPPHPSVRTAADGVVEIERAYVEEVTRNLKSFMALGYSRPHNEDDVKGWYISGFGCTSPVYKAGFRRRDVLLRVNGKKTRSWTGVYMLYQRLKRKSEFEVELLRRGTPVRLQFRVVEDWASDPTLGRDTLRRLAPTRQPELATKHRIGR